MRLAICDDDDLERNFLHSLLKKYFSETSISCEFTLYDRGTNLYCDVAEEIEYDMIFLDLFLKDSFGMDIAKKLRDEGYGGKIIFCTVSADYALESYNVYASGYILKPYSLKDIRATLDRLISEYECNCYAIRQKAQVVYIPLNEILYVESNNTKCILHRRDGRRYNVYKKLADIEAELKDPRFLRCHQSYLVNMDHIQSAGDNFVMDSGDVVQIRQNGAKEIKENTKII
mgnify:CR=1 FL=1